MENQTPPSQPAAASTQKDDKPAGSPAPAHPPEPASRPATASDDAGAVKEPTAKASIPTKAPSPITTPATPPPSKVADPGSAHIPDKTPTPNKAPAPAPDKTQEMTPDKAPASAPDKTQDLAPEKTPAPAPTAHTPDKTPAPAKDKTSAPNKSPAPATHTPDKASAPAPAKPPTTKNASQNVVNKNPVHLQSHMFGKQPVVITVDPSKASFTTAGGRSKHLVVNKTTDRLAIKVRSSNNVYFRVSPVFSFLDNNGMFELDVYRSKGGGARNDKLQLIYVVCTATDDDASKLFGLRAKVRSVVLPIVTTICIS